MYYPKRKYHNKKVEIDGLKFDSQFECNYYYKLKLLERAGEIHDLQTQVDFTLFEKSKYGRRLVYRSDFVYFDKEGKRHIVDTKSKATRTRLYLLKKRILQELYDIEIEEVLK